MVSIGKIFAIKFLFKPEKMLDNKMVKGIERPRIRENKDNFCIFNMTWEFTIINPKPEKLPKQK